MSTSFTTIAGSITAPKGFLAAGVFCDIKRLGTGKGSERGQKRDLALIVSQAPAAVAGLFTTNQVCAAPVRVSLPRANQLWAQAIVANSGNANACTGARGLQDAQMMTELAARHLTLSAKHVLVCSTGRIGLRLPMSNVRRGIVAATEALSESAESAHEAAEAIMTSDTRSKEIAVEFEVGGRTVRIGGICKGAGMIQPALSPTGGRPAAMPLHATMLCFITSDVAIAPPALKMALREAVAKSLNRITVDGDMSTNDAVIALANGLAGNPIITGESRTAFARFQAALDHVTLELARMIVRDGEGVTRFITVRLSGARSAAEADAAARAVANSALVKTSWFGGDPNWGRILDALGYSTAKVDEARVDVGYRAPSQGRIIFAVKKGQATRSRFETLRSITGRGEFDLHINLNLGKASAVIYTADLTEAYVDFNKGE